MDFGNRLIELREELGLSREELANKLNITYSALSKYETNKRFPDKETLGKLADFFDVSVDFLLCRTNIRKFDDFPAPVKRVAELFAGVDWVKAKKLEKILLEVKELLEK